MSKFLVQLREELQPQNAGGGGFRISLCVCVCVSWVWVCVCMSAANCLYTVCGAQLVASLLKRTNALPLVYRIQYITAHYWFTRQHIYYVDALSLSWWLVLIADRPDRESESESDCKRETEIERERELLFPVDLAELCKPWPIAKSSFILRSYLMLSSSC